MNMYFNENIPDNYKLAIELHNLLDKELSKDKILSCLILKDDYLIYQYYKNKKIENNIQSIHSCTKSFVSALVGCCIDRGIINDINTPIIEYFGDLILNQQDHRKQEITLYHLLTMTDGLDWPEFGEWHFFSPMNYEKDIINFILGRELKVTPGEKMNYNSGCSHLLSYIIQKVTGEKLSEIIKDYLFNPLDIVDFRWYERKGVCLGADGLKIKPIDLLKLGYLYLKNGKIGNKEIISFEWIQESIKSRFLTYTSIGYYGYHWWSSDLCDENGRKIEYYFAMGYGGQFVIVIPLFNAVVSFVSISYKDTLMPMKYFKKCILKVIQSLDNYK